MTLLPPIRHVAKIRFLSVIAPEMEACIYRADNRSWRTRGSDTQIKLRDDEKIKLKQSPDRYEAYEQRISRLRCMSGAR